MNHITVSTAGDTVLLECHGERQAMPRSEALGILQDAQAGKLDWGLSTAEQSNLIRGLELALTSKVSGGASNEWLTKRHGGGKSYRTHGMKAHSTGRHSKRRVGVVNYPTPIGVISILATRHVSYNPAKPTPGGGNAQRTVEETPYGEGRKGGARFSSKTLVHIENRASARVLTGVLAKLGYSLERLDLRKSPDEPYLDEWRHVYTTDCPHDKLPAPEGSNYWRLHLCAEDKRYERPRKGVEWARM